MITRNIACGCQRFRVSPQVSGEERHRLFGLWGIDIAKLPDGGQAIVQEVGLNLGQPDGDPPSGGGISQMAPSPASSKTMTAPSMTSTPSVGKYFRKSGGASST